MGEDPLKDVIKLIRLRGGKCSAVVCFTSQPDLALAEEK